MTKSKQSRLDQIADSIVENNICSELSVGATQLVFGVGNPDADVVFIGEAPGKKEDEQGEPFVGAAGKFLDEMLQSINLERGDVYITNIVKYRPPDNRDPLPDEKSEFWPYLLRQLEVIEPKLIVTLGRHSMENFLSGQRIGQIHGQPKRIRVIRSTDYETRETTESDIRTPDSEEAEGSGESAVQDADEHHTGTENNTSMRLDAAQGNLEERSETHETVRRSSTAKSDAAMRQERSRPGELGSPTGERAAWVVLPLYHPAAALYNGGQRQTLLDDFAKIPRALELIETEGTG